MATYNYQLVIIGAGSGGLAAAELAGAMSLQRVALVEKSDRLGGECLHTGCVPSKALLHAAKTAKKDPWKHVQSSINTIEDRSDNDSHIANLGINVLHGKASFVDKHTLRVGNKTITSRYFLITTGSSPFVPPIPGLDATQYETNETIFSLPNAPKSLGIIGGGPIGAEMATAFSALGSRVHVLERSDHILSRLDQDSARVVTESLISQGVTIHTNTDAKKVSQSKQQVVITTDNRSIKVDKLLLAVGRTPNTDLDLEAAGVAYDRSGISIDKKLRTTSRNIYAIGDVTPSPKFTHLAAHQASIALQNMLSPGLAFSAKRLLPTPAITYTWPEIGSFGIPEDEALKKRGAKKMVYSLAENDRAVTDENTAGFIKLVVSRWGRILHCTVASENASELLTPLLILYTRKRTILELAYVVIPYPTTASILSNIAADFSTQLAKKVPGWRILTRKWRD